MLLDCVDEVLNYYCPLKKVSYSPKKSKSKLWITQDKLKSTAVKNRLHRKMCRTKDTTRKTELEKKVKHYKNNLVKLTRSGKANRYNNFLNESKLNLLKTWNRIRKIINIRPKKTNYVTSLQFNNTIISDSKLIANLFNNLFTSIAKDIEQKLISSKFKYSDYLKNLCQQTFFLTPTNEQDVLKTIKFINRNKASKSFNISTKF